MIQICFTFNDKPPEVIRRLESDFAPGHWNKLGVSMETHHMAETIVATNLDTGKSVMLKNRYGPAVGMIDDIIQSEAATVMKNERKALVPMNRLPKIDEEPKKALKVNMTVTDEDLKGILKDVERELRAAFDRLTGPRKLTKEEIDAVSVPQEQRPGRGRFPDIDNDVGPVLSPPKAVICQCNIADLLSNGHVDGCPEKKK